MDNDVAERERERERELDILAPPGGFIRAYVDYACAAAPAPVAYHIGAALALLATVGLTREELSLGILLVGPPDRCTDLNVLSCAGRFAEDVMDSWAYRLVASATGPQSLGVDQVVLAVAPDYGFDPTSAVKVDSSAEAYLVIPSVLVDTPQGLRRAVPVDERKRSVAAGLLDGLWQGTRKAPTVAATLETSERKLAWQLRILYELDRHCGAAGPVPGAPSAVNLLLEESDWVLASRVST